MNVIEEMTEEFRHHDAGEITMQENISIPTGVTGQS
jgi:hypothetical protein